MTNPRKDETLLALLSENARMPVAELARRLSLSRTTVQARIEALERSGLITGYTVRLSDVAERALVRAYASIVVKPKMTARTIGELQAMPEIRRLHSVSGDTDLIAELAATTVAVLDAAIDRIGELDGVERTRTSVILATKIDR